MNRNFLTLSLFFFLVWIPYSAAQDVLHGRVTVDLEPVYGFFVDEKAPLDNEEAYRRALEEAAYLFSSQIYGWSFHYDIGERARGIAEEYKLEPEGSIPWGDPAIKVTEAKFTENQFEVWIDYIPGDMQSRRIRAWKQGLNRKTQSTGFASPGDIGHDGLIPPGTAEASTWFNIRKTALEDAARAAVREILRGSERNRPKEAHGFVSLETFPRYFMSSGRLACAARFLVNISEIIPFAVH